MLTLILGGARSGKSDLAQRLASASGHPVTVIATMEPGDDEMREKIAAHRAVRPADWRTVEAPRDIEAEVARAPAGDLIVLDCLTVWISNLLLARLDPESIASANAHAAIGDTLRRTNDLVAAVQAHAGDTIVVSNEVGMGLVPPYPIGRVFRDALGAANRIVAARADRVYAVTAGLALDIKALGARPLDAFGAVP